MKNSLPGKPRRHRHEPAHRDHQEPAQEHSEPAPKSKYARPKYSPASIEIPAPNGGSVRAEGYEAIGVPGGQLAAGSRVRLWAVNPGHRWPVAGGSLDPRPRAACAFGMSRREMLGNARLRHRWWCSAPHTEHSDRPTAGSSRARVSVPRLELRDDQHERCPGTCTSTQAARVSRDSRRPGADWLMAAPP
jgi:hypothetical protein